jgi:hypothetical protein
MVNGVRRQALLEYGSVLVLNDHLVEPTVMFKTVSIVTSFISYFRLPSSGIRESKSTTSSHLVTLQQHVQQFTQHLLQE